MTGKPEKLLDLKGTDLLGLPIKVGRASGVKWEGENADSHQQGCRGDMPVGHAFRHLPVWAWPSVWPIFQMSALPAHMRRALFLQGS